METKQQVLAAFEEHGLSHLTEKLLPHIRSSIRLTYAKEQPDEYPLGASRIGGLPDLPPNIEWCQWRGMSTYEPGGPLLFLAQINLRELALYDADHLLPKIGMLYFFAASWVNCLTDYSNIPTS